MTTAKRRPGVKLVRGPFVRLPPHADACTSGEALVSFAESLRAQNPSVMLAADLFSGAGGLSLGLEQAGVRIVLAVDHDPEAAETHAHHFGGLTLDWDLAEPTVVEKVAELICSAGIDVLAGGPPCQPFSRASRSGIRARVRQGLRDPHDQRRDLWRSFLEVTRLCRPRAVVMENVPDMALDREMFILRSMVLELEQLGYAVEERLVDTSQYGVPQFRQRLILVALADGVRFRWPAADEHVVKVSSAISDLPPVKGGWRPPGGADGWQAYGGPRTRFQRAMRLGVPPEQSERVYDHITRPVRADDELAFDLMDTETLYSDLPAEYKRYRDDIFDDKYKRLDEHDLSRTITAHIAKDGYWYIHPEQNRTITVREAARLQTFPDWYRFAGPPSAAFRQIGNAVPPALGHAIGRGLTPALVTPVSAAASSETIATILADWFRAIPEPSIPWLRARTRWQVLSAERLLERTTPQNMRSLWPLLDRFRGPSATVTGAEDLLEIAGWIRRQDRARQLLALARHLTDDGNPDLTDELLTELVSRKAIPPAHADMASLVVGMGDEDSSEEPVIINKGVLRVAANFTGMIVHRRNRMSEGRIAVARMIGYGSDARTAHLALMELSSSLCRPADPLCGQCPLAGLCSEGRKRLAIAGSSSGVVRAGGSGISRYREHGAPRPQGSH
jgi:DNA (cytosine-5)-methyltransferase 1